MPPETMVLRGKEEEKDSEICCGGRFWNFGGVDSQGDQWGRNVADEFAT